MNALRTAGWSWLSAAGLALLLSAGTACIRAELDDDGESEEDGEDFGGAGHVSGGGSLPPDCRTATIRCGSAQSCNPVTGGCEARACTSDTDCTYDTFCHPERGQCLACNADTCDRICSRNKCVECTDNSHCAPTQECYIDDRCHDRCDDNTDCPPDSVCGADTCSDPVGRPCVMSGLSCHGGRCVDVDANLVTVPPYCTVACGFNGFSCPSGFACKTFDCVKL